MANSKYAEILEQSSVPNKVWKTALYLRLSITKEVSVSEVKRIVQKWYVLSVLTGRYSASPESAFYRDIRRINEVGVVKALEDIGYRGYLTIEREVGDHHNLDIMNAVKFLENKLEVL